MKLANVHGLPWQSVIDQHIADPRFKLMAEFLVRDVADFGSEEHRINAWMAAVKAQDPRAAASRATWHRLRTEVEDVIASPRPVRIILQRNRPAEESRPSDSLIRDMDIE